MADFQYPKSASEPALTKEQLVDRRYKEWLLEQGELYLPPAFGIEGHKASIKKPDEDKTAED